MSIQNIIRLRNPNYGALSKTEGVACTELRSPKDLEELTIEERRSSVSHESAGWWMEHGMGGWRTLNRSEFLVYEKK